MAQMAHVAPMAPMEHVAPLAPGDALSTPEVLLLWAAGGAGANVALMTHMALTTHRAAQVPIWPL